MSFPPPLSPLSPSLSPLFSFLSHSSQEKRRLVSLVGLHGHYTCLRVAPASAPALWHRVLPMDMNIVIGFHVCGVWGVCVRKEVRECVAQVSDILLSLSLSPAQADGRGSCPKKEVQLLPLLFLSRPPLFPLHSNVGLSSSFLLLLPVHQLLLCFESSCEDCAQEPALSI